MKSIELKRKKLEYTLQLIWCINLIVITNIIGSVGMEYFGYAYEIYTLFYILTIGSFPMAIYKLFKMRQQKEKLSESRKVLKASGILATIYAVLGSVLLYLISDMFLTDYCGNSFAGIILKFFIPIYIFQCILQVLTGYFHAMGSIAATVFIRIIESLVSLISSIFIALSLRQYGSKIAALLLDENYTSAYGSLGFPASLICGALLAILLFGFILLLNKRNHKGTKPSAKSEESILYLTKLLVRTMASYVCIGFLARVSLFISFLLDNKVLMTSDKIVADYGLLYGIFLPFTGVFILLFSLISLGKVSIITTSMKKQEYKRAKECFQTWLHLLIIIVGFVAVVIISLANSFAGLLFKSASKELATMLQMGGITILFAAYSLFFIDFLQTIKKFQKIYLALGIALFAFIVVMLLVNKVSDLQTLSFIYAFDAFWAVLLLTNGYFVCQALKTSVQMNSFFLIPVFTLAVIGFALTQFEKLLLHMLGDGLCILICTVIALVIYVCVLTFSHNIQKEEIIELPLGKKFLQLAAKLHLLS